MSNMYYRDDPYAHYPIDLNPTDLDSTDPDPTNSDSTGPDPEDRFYKVYRVDSRNNYDGFALIGAENADKANEHIKEFKASDPHNELDSRGWDSSVSEDDIVEDLFTTRNDIVLNSIRYTG